MSKEKKIEDSIIDPKKKAYKKAIVISNLRLRLSPGGVFYCENTADIISILTYCNENNIAFRIRSGGHHHEGACSGNAVVIIDTSKINEIKIEGNKLVVGPGAKLEAVYSALFKEKKILPGGGCESVAIGGLVQGAGWGPYSRLLGMTCDFLTSAEIIIFEGNSFKKINVSSENYSTLFKAIKGSGGGNYGVISELTFKLYDLVSTYDVANFAIHPEVIKNLKMVNESEVRSDILAFDIYIEDENEAKKQASNWLKNAHLADPRITSFARIYPKTKNNTTRFYIGARVLHANEDNLISYIKNLLGEVPYKSKIVIKNEPFKKDLATSKTSSKIAVNEGGFSQNSNRNLLNMAFSFGKHIEENNAIQSKKSNLAPKSTCDKPHPHKVSSFFPIKEVPTEELIKTIFNYMDRKFLFLDEKIACYLSLHGMGGAIMETPDNSFYYQDRPYLFQIQAWWEDVNSPNEAKYLSWVEGLRKEVSPYSEGCFVNFPDYNCILDKKHPVYNPNNDNQRQLLLEQFFGQEVEKKGNLLYELKKVKKEYDPCNIFKHEMSLIF